MGFLVALVLAFAFARMVSVGECVECFEVLALLLPVFLSGDGVLLLTDDHLTLRLDGIVEAVEEFLVVVPFALGDSLLRGLAESFGVLVAVLLDHRQLVLRILLAGDQASEFERCLVGSFLHEV